MKCFHHSIKNVGNGEEGDDVGSGEEDVIVGNGKEDDDVDREQYKIKNWFMSTIVIQRLEMVECVVGVVDLKRSTIVEIRFL